MRESSQEMVLPGKKCIESYSSERFFIIIENGDEDLTVAAPGIPCVIFQNTKIAQEIGG